MIKLIEENVNTFIENGKLSNTDAENILIHIEHTNLIKLTEYDYEEPESIA